MTEIAVNTIQTIKQLVPNTHERQDTCIYSMQMLDIKLHIYLAPFMEY